MNKIEKLGIDLLKEYLNGKNRQFEKSPNKTFDLVVDGYNAEVKCKSNPYNQIDFISITENQKNEISSDYIIFLVCNIDDPDNCEIYEFKSTRLNEIEPKTIVHYEYNKGKIDKLDLHRIN